MTGNSDRELQRLTIRYAQMEDAELERVAVDFLSLTEPAKYALSSEMSKRGLAPPDEIAAHRAREIAETEARIPVVIRRYRDRLKQSLRRAYWIQPALTAFWRMTI